MHGLSDDTLPRLVQKTTVFPESMSSELRRISPSAPGHAGLPEPARPRSRGGLGLIAVLLLGAVLGAGGAIAVSGGLKQPFPQVAGPAVPDEIDPEPITTPLFDVVPTPTPTRSPSPTRPPSPAPAEDPESPAPSASPTPADDSESPALPGAQ